MMYVQDIPTYLYLGKCAFMYRLPGAGTASASYRRCNMTGSKEYRRYNAYSFSGRGRKGVGRPPHKRRMGGRGYLRDMLNYG